MQWAKQKQIGFTIVELLIVVVVIAILAAITIVAYNGIQDRARQAVTDGAVTDASKKIKLYAVDSGDSFPPSLATVGFTNSSSTEYRYSVDNASSPKTYCVTAISGSKSSYITQDGTVKPGRCSGHDGQYVTNLITNPGFEVGTDGWEVENATVARSTEQANTGTFSLKVTPGPDVETFVRSAWVDLEDGGDYYIQAKTRLFVHSMPIATASNVQVEYRYSIAGSGTMLVGNGPVVSNWNGGVNGMFRYANYGGGTGTLRARISIGANYANGAAKTPFYIDSAMIVKVNSVPSPTYFDGNSAGWMWNGAVGNSTSTGRLP